MGRKESNQTNKHLCSCFSIANSVDQDQTATLVAVWFMSTLFVCMLKLVIGVHVRIFMQQMTLADNIFSSRWLPVFLT